MTNEFSPPQISVKSIKGIPTFKDILVAKRQNDEIYYNGKLLSKNLDEAYTATLIDYAALATFKNSYPPGEIQAIEAGDYGYLGTLSYSIGWDLKNLYEHGGYKKLILNNNLALRLLKEIIEGVQLNKSLSIFLVI